MTATLTVWVQPRASREKIVGMMGDALKVAVTAPPEKGKANKAAAKLLAGELGLPVKAVTVVSGTACRRKVVSVEGLSQKQLDDRIAEIKSK